MKKELVHSDIYYVLGTMVRFSLWGDESQAQKAIDQAVKKLYEIDDKMSYFKEDSEVSKINAMAGKGTVKVSSDTFEVISVAKRFGSLTNGALDVTFRRKGQEIDLGSIAKGFAADKVAEIFRSYEIESALINLGGNIYVIGNDPSNQPWRIGIRDPFGERNEIIGSIEVSDKSIVTSGNYEHEEHLVDPRTGRPVDNDLASVSIISNRSIDGDALATAGMVLGLEEGMRLMKSIDGIQAIFITNDREIKLSNSDLKWGDLNEKAI